jgi:hypothetical protein
MSPRRILIVSPHFPPANTPDMQRVRQSLPHFIAAGWDVTVLTVDDPTPLAPVEPELLDTVPAAVRVVRAHCCSRRWTRWLGVNNVALRALPFLFITGCRLLSARRHDAVYFSTTMFIVLPFGRVWRRLYGVPYVIDLQDPWVTDFYERPGAPPPPGGWKYRFARGLGRLLEGWTMHRVAHVVTVSAAYAAALRQRYPELRHTPSTELPFGSPDPDLQHLRETLAGRPAILPRAGFRLAFAGALGPGMLVAVETLFAAVAELNRTGTRCSVHFYGTSYAEDGHGQPVTAALAARYGLQDCVQEQPGRLRYFAALQVTLEADAKILPLLGAGRPILALGHAGSALATRLAALHQPCVLVEGERPTPAAVTATLARLREVMLPGSPPPRPSWRFCLPFRPAGPSPPSPWNLPAAPRSPTKRSWTIPCWAANTSRAAGGCSSPA